ncbi:MAG TPA: hypothetical protein VGB63_15760 [Pedobacter sp.]
MGALFLTLLSWNLAFRKTIKAISLNNELHQKADKKNDLSQNPGYLNRKHRVLNVLLKQYTLDSAEWKNDFWLKVSGIAASKEVRISYNPLLKQDLSDSTSRVLKQEISFEGDYKKMVILLDSLEKTASTGFICSSNFKKGKQGNNLDVEKLTLNAVFGIVQK